MLEEEEKKKKEEVEDDGLRLSINQPPQSWATAALDGPACVVALRGELEVVLVRCNGAPQCFSCFSFLSFFWGGALAMNERLWRLSAVRVGRK